MTDKEVFELLDKRNTDILTEVDRSIGSHIKSVTMLITTENENIKHSIDELTKRVDKQNSSVAGLKEWRSELIGKADESRLREEKSNKQSLRIIMIIGIFITAIGIASGIWLKKGQEKLQTVQEDIKEEIRDGSVTRGGMIITTPKNTFVLDSARVDSIVNDLINR